MSTTTMIPAAAARPAMRFHQPLQTVRFNVADPKMFERTYHAAPVIPETVGRVAETGKMEADVALSYQFDAHCELVKHVPRPSGMGDQLIRELMRRLRESKDYQALRQVTICDDVAAGLGACSLTEQTVMALSEELKKEAQRQREAKRDAEEAKAHADAVNDDPDATDEDKAQAEESAQEARQKADAAGKALELRLKHEGKAVAQAVAKAVAAAKDGAQAAKDVQECFGWGNNTGDPSGGFPVEEKFRLARQIQKSGPAFRKFVEVLGRLTRTALRKQASKTKHEAGEIVDVEQGSDVERVLEDELVQLIHPAFRKLAQFKFASETLMQHEVDQKEPMAKGDVVVLIDESTSMSGQKEAEAKGIALALAHVCAKQRRKLVVHFFQSTVTLTVKIDPQDAKSVEDGMNVAARKLGQIAGRGTAGGTNFDAPLLTACETVRTGGMDKADVLMVTDGQCNVKDETVKTLNDLRAATGAKVYSVLLGGSDPGAVEVLSKFSDKVWNAETLMGRVAEELFELF